MSDDYLSRDELLACLTETHEKTIRPPLFGRRPILIREVTARQRVMAVQAAQTDDPDTPDQQLYRAMLIQMSVVDPNSGTPGPDGVIDPRTRTPLLTVADVQAIADGRELFVDALVADISALAALAPVSLFRRHPGTDGAERDADQGVGAGPAAPGEDEGVGPGAADQRPELHPEPAGDAGGEPGALE